MKTQVKAVWSILIMTTIWLTMNTSKINNQATEQEKIDAVVQRMLQSLEEKEQEAAEEEQQITFKEAFAEARAELGADNAFIWNGDVYTTDYAEETTEANYVVGGWVMNADDYDDYCATNDRDECGICGGKGKSVWYADRDGDGLGDIKTTMKACEEPLWSSK